jgi:hypothetical protein
MDNAMIAADFYQGNLDNYLKVGGFLRAVSDFIKDRGGVI